MPLLDDLPLVNSFLGIDLKTGSMIIAAIGIIHPMAYGCSFFVPMSYLLVTIWILVSLFFAASVVLFYGLAKDSALLCAIWVWYTVIFVVVMLMMMILLALLFTSRKQRNRVFVVIFGMLWYMLTIYFILVVNSHRRELMKNKPALLSPGVGGGAPQGDDAGGGDLSSPPGGDVGDTGDGGDSLRMAEFLSGDKLQL